MSIDLARITEAGTRLAEIANKVNDLSAIKPLNLTREIDSFRHALQTNTVYNPVFEYLPTDTGYQLLGKIQQFMAWLEPGEDSLQGRIEKAYWERAFEDFIIEYSRQYPTPNALTAAAIHVYGNIDSSLLKKAKERLEKGSESEESIRIDGEELAPHYQEFLTKFGFTGWLVEVSDDIMTSVIVDRNPYKRIRIRRGYKFSIPEFRHILVTHAVARIGRTENAERYSNVLPFLMTHGFAGYQTTEFGLTPYLISKVSGQDFDPGILYAARYLAAYTCLSSSFYETFMTVKDYLPENEALDLVTRLKRGIRDTSMPGGFIKDTMYWRGSYLVKEQLESSPERLEILLLGKLGIDNIPLIKELIEAQLITPQLRDANELFNYIEFRSKQLELQIKSRHQE